MFTYSCTHIHLHIKIFSIPWRGKAELLPRQKKSKAFWRYARLAGQSLGNMKSGMGNAAPQLDRRADCCQQAAYRWPISHYDTSLHRMQTNKRPIFCQSLARRDWHPKWTRLISDSKLNRTRVLSTWLKSWLYDVAYILLILEPSKSLVLPKSKINSISAGDQGQEDSKHR